MALWLCCIQRVTTANQWAMPHAAPMSCERLQDSDSYKAALRSHFLFLHAQACNPLPLPMATSNAHNDPLRTPDRRRVSQHGPESTAADMLLPPTSRTDEPAHDTVSFDQAESTSSYETDPKKLPAAMIREADHGIRDNKHRATHWYNIWWIELTALAFSLACVVANAVILYTLHGKPYTSWQIRGVQITPNTLVSVVATFSKSALLLPVAEGIAQLKWRKLVARVTPLSVTVVMHVLTRPSS